MTDIPGTSKTSFEKEKEKEKISSQPKAISIVNVSEIKRVKKEGFPPKYLFWYDDLKYWLFISIIPSFLFLILGVFINWSYLLLIPGGPIIAIISWYVRKIAKRYEKRFDVLK